MKTPSPTYDQARLEDAVLALLGATAFEGGRVWKRYDFSIMDALHARGLITNPAGRAEPVHLTRTGTHRAKELAAAMLSPES